jgi:hypothetical protein
MKSSDEAWREMRAGWEHFGRAAEHFAERVADDARRFARRVEEHMGEFAQEVGREGKCGTEHRDASGRRPPGEEVRRIFEDVRGVLAAVLQGVDELITEAFSGRARDEWTRVVSNHDAICAACARPILAGTEAFVRRRAGAREFRCLACGPGEGPQSA